ncbi:MAG: hypothetical protein ACK5N8_00130 [Alphaproteobacteria bacterium]
MKKIYFSVFILSVLFSVPAEAQLSATKDAQYLIIAKVVADYKMQDEEFVNDIDSLRDNERFNRKLQRMLESISNSRSKDSKNRQIVNILEKAGKDIDKILNIR